MSNVYQKLLQLSKQMLEYVSIFCYFLNQTYVYIGFKKCLLVESQFICTFKMQSLKFFKGSFSLELESGHEFKPFTTNI